MFENNNPEYFMTIVNEHSISKAAEKLFISQPYLSQYVARLEKKLGVKLLDRSKTPLIITEAGQIYYNYLESGYQLYRKMSADLDVLNRERDSELNLGFSPWRASTFLPDVLPAFIKAHPKVHIMLHERPLDVMYDLVTQNTVDFAIMNSNLVTPDNLITEVIRYETAVLVANKQNPITFKLLNAIKDNHPNPLKTIENENFLLLSKRLPIGSRVHNYLEKCKIFPVRKIMTTNNMTALNLVSANLGFSFLLDTGTLRANRDENLVFIDLKSPDLYIPLCVVYRKDTSLSRIAREFINTSKNYYSQIKFSFIQS